jgi:hypothetical protein
MADSWNPLIRQGETFVATITVTGVNLAGYTVRSKGRLSHASTSTVWDLSTTTSGISVSAGADSVITMTLTAAQTAALTAWSCGVFDIEYQSPGGVVTRFLEGNFVVSGESTK